ncbi:MAG: PEP-CTERM sorting domain-containing protein, partial [Candidatus Omnitrophica bacterium]|nr:PEP-CTERM sorting domain-containing protein [Candidatus Omnitrophota bacterium]
SSSSSSSYTSDYTANSSPTPAYYPVGDDDFASTDYAHSPEPCTLALFGIGLAGMAYSAFKKKKR